jgi:hypothetical protein
MIAPRSGPDMPAQSIGGDPDDQWPGGLHARERLVVGPRHRLRARRHALQQRAVRARLGDLPADALHRVAVAVTAQHEGADVDDLALAQPCGQVPVDDVEGLVGGVLALRAQRDHEVVGAQPVGGHRIAEALGEDDHVQRLDHPDRDVLDARHRPRLLGRLHQDHRIVERAAAHHHPLDRPGR